MGVRILAGAYDCDVAHMTRPLFDVIRQIGMIDHAMHQQIPNKTTISMDDTTWSNRYSFARLMNIRTFWICSEVPFGDGACMAKCIYSLARNETNESESTERETEL